MSKRLPENCDSSSLDESDKDAELLPKDYPYLKRLLAEIDLLKDRKRLPSVDREHPERTTNSAKSTPRRVPISTQKHAR